MPTSILGIRSCEFSNRLPKSLSSSSRRIIKGLEKLFAKIQQGQQIYRRTQERQARKRKQEKGPEQDGAESVRPLPIRFKESEI